LIPAWSHPKEKDWVFGTNHPDHNHAHHNHSVTPAHFAARTAFCQNLLTNLGWLPLIHFSDKSRFVLRHNKRWVWDRQGEESESTIRPTDKFPPSVMIFEVIGINRTSGLLCVEGIIDAES
jgi:hypothetical protein